MPSPQLKTLREINHRLRAALIRLRPERTSCASLRPQDFSALLGELLRAAECLRTPSADPSETPELAREAADYRQHLEELKKFLPALQVELLAERSRLETSRTHLTSAAAWAGANKKTF